MEKNSRPPLTFLAYDYSRAVETYVTDWYGSYQGTFTRHSGSVRTIGEVESVLGRIVLKVA